MPYGKGERKVTKSDDSSDDEHASDDDSDSDDDDSPSYDDLVHFLSVFNGWKKLGLYFGWTQVFLISFCWLRVLVVF